MDKIRIYTDGGARGNPGPMGIGYVIKIQNPKSKIQNINPKFKIKKEQKDLGYSDEYETIYEHGEYIGEGTNNQAEYKALQKALTWFLETKNEKRKTKNEKEEEFVFSNIKEIVCHLDSELIVKQLNGEYKVKNEGLRPMFEEVKNLIGKIDAKIQFVHIPREQNKRADYLVNKAIDEYLKNVIN